MVLAVVGLGIQEISTGSFQAVIFNIRAAFRSHLGRIWVAFGPHLGCIRATFGPDPALRQMNP